MDLFHISYLPIREFHPKIPRNRLDNENDSIPRICLSPFIPCCISAKAGKGEYIRLSLKDNIPCLLYIYKMECNEKNILPPDKVMQYGVPDANLNQEYWLLSDPVNVEEKIVKVINATFEDYDRIEGIEFTENIEKTDFLFVEFCQRYNEEVRKSRNTTRKLSYASPEIMMPQMWDDMVRLYRQYKK